MESTWEQKSLEELGKITSSRRIFKKEYVDEGIPFFRTKEVKELAAGRKITTELFISKERYEDISEKSGVPLVGDILLTAIGTIGEIYVIKDNEPFYFKDGNVLWLKNFDNIDSYYLKYALIGFVDELKRMSRGAAYNALPIERLKKHKILVPPLEHQKRIVAKIEELFSHIDAGIAALNKSKLLLKQYRQSVLKAAVTGELTQQWREDNKNTLEPASKLLERILVERREKWEAQQLAQFEAKGKIPKGDNWKKKYKEPEKPSFKPELPDSWLACSLEQLILELKNGISKKPSEDNGLAILRISAVRPMKVHKDDVRYLPLDFKSDTFEIENGDLLFTRYNGNPELVGVCGKVRGLKTKTVYPDKLMRARPVSTSFLSTDYLELSLNCGVSKDFIRTATKTTAGQSGVAGGDVKRCPTILPPYEEQVVIAKIVSEKIEAMERLELSLDLQRDQAEKTKQSILASAFSGKLT